MPRLYAQSPTGKYLRGELPDVLSHLRLTVTASFAATDDPQCEAQQSEECHSRTAAGLSGLRDGCERIGEKLTHYRHAASDRRRCRESAA
jgi:hypothetical protein